MKRRDVKRPSMADIRADLARRIRLDAEEARRLDALDQARTDEAIQRFVESTYISLDDLETAHRRAEASRRTPSH